MIALDQATGRIKWSTTIADYKQGALLSAQPQYYKGTIFTGVSGGDFGYKSKVVALNATTGKVKWNFNVIPQKPGDPGFSSWPKKRAYNGGGAMWNTPTIDPKLG